MNELYHYNHNHDPRTGQFSSSPIGAGGTGRHGKITKRDIKRANKRRKFDERRLKNVSDEELKKMTDRLALEVAYQKLYASSKDYKQKYSTSQYVANKTVEKLTDAYTRELSKAISAAITAAVDKKKKGNGGS